MKEEEDGERRFWKVEREGGREGVSEVKVVVDGDRYSHSTPCSRPHSHHSSLAPHAAKHRPPQHLAR